MSVNLTAVSNEDLMNELRSRNLVVSVWAQDDFDALIENDEDCADFTDEQRVQCTILALEEVDGDLEDHLANKGNEFTAERWEVIREDVIAKVRASTPTP